MDGGRAGTPAEINNAGIGAQSYNNNHNTDIIKNTHTSLFRGGHAQIECIIIINITRPRTAVKRRACQPQRRRPRPGVHGNIIAIIIIITVAETTTVTFACRTRRRDDRRRSDRSSDVLSPGISCSLYYGKWVRLRLLVMGSRGPSFWWFRAFGNRNRRNLYELCDIYHYRYGHAYILSCTVSPCGRVVLFFFSSTVKTSIFPCLIIENDNGHTANYRYFKRFK